MRTSFDLSHFSFSCGKIGALQTLSVIPTLPGDSFNINVAMTFRLAPLRRALSLDAHIDLYAFWIPHRHCYVGQGEENQFIKFIKQGLDPNAVVTLDSYTLPHHIQCFGTADLGGVIPRWLALGYDRIYNRYFKHPTDPDKSILLPGTSEDNLRYGLSTCYDKTLWTTCLRSDKNRTGSMGKESAPVSGGEASVDIWSLEQVKNAFNNVAQRDWFDIRYSDLLQQTWGSSINIDVEQKPRLLGMNRSYLSGYDVDGTAPGSLGTSGGKAFGQAILTVPRIFMPEHGAVWLMANVRFPTIHVSETHRLFKDASPSYTDFAGDARVVSGYPPEQLKVKDVFHSDSTQTLGYQPFGQHYRYHPNAVHQQFDNLNGFPFLSKLPVSENDAHYIRPDEYDLTFQSPDQLGHWNSQGHINVAAKRIYPDSVSSIFAG